MDTSEVRANNQTYLIVKAGLEYESNRHRQRHSHFGRDQTAH